MDKPCQECVTKDQEIAELKDYLAFMREQVEILKETAKKLESIFEPSSKK